MRAAANTVTAISVVVIVASIAAYDRSVCIYCSHCISWDLALRSQAPMLSVQMRPQFIAEADVRRSVQRRSFFEWLPVACLPVAPPACLGFSTVDLVVLVALVDLLAR